ncbi:MAG: bacillithiol biosynthesis BshC [Acidobacteriota bacterium]
MTSGHQELQTSLRLPLERYPGINPLALDLVRGEARAARFYSARRGAASAGSNRSADRGALAAALSVSNSAWGNDVEKALQLWATGQTTTLIAGQQVGFAGGPLLVLDKIASLLRCRSDLAAKGKAATAFFWMATEDHDFAEVAQFALSGLEGVRRFESTQRVPLRHVVGSLPVPADLRALLLEVLDVRSADWLGEGINLRDSFARLLSEVFAGDELILVDSLQPELRAGGRDLFRSIISKRDVINTAIASRSEEIRQAGYTPQVSPGEDGEYTLLYLIREGIRHPLRTENESEVAAAIENEPESISTAALARPLLQDLVFAPDVFIGGPSEVAYYAQITPVHEMLSIARPRVALRGHLLVAPARYLRSALGHGLQPDEILEPPEMVIARKEASAIETMQETIDKASVEIRASLDRVKAEILASDRGLEKSVARTLRRIDFHLARLRQRGERAAIRHDQERYQAFEKLHGMLMPGGEPQDRLAAWLPWWLKYGDRLKQQLIAEIRPDSDSFVVAGL